MLVLNSLPMNHSGVIEITNSVLGFLDYPLRLESALLLLAEETDGHVSQ
ncbi:MAG: hypothetical protein HXS41_12135 [Theionarchaea archaeon]|nr:hypothetical protein [Theionarchaea archaeon]MBU7021800.1 hypothetical protein [Theionarchaea archaeon]